MDNISRIPALMLALITLFLVSCDHETEPDGPNLLDRFGPFNVVDSLSVNRTDVDFSIGEVVTFSAEFNKNVNWVITITGNASGAVKRIEGFDRFINSGNAVWNGTTTELPLFKNETCLIELTIPEEPDYLDTAEVEVIGPRAYQGMLVTDFENGLNPGFNRFVQSGANMRFDTIVGPGVQGNVYYEMSGEVVFADDLGNVSMPKSAFTNPDFALNTNPELAYFNLFARKGPGAVEDIFVFQIMEDDNGSGAYEPNQDDAYEFVIQTLTLDWDLYSVQYSNLTTFNSNGGGIKNPDRVIQVVVLPIGLNEPFEGYLDYLIFTNNGPLVP